MTRAAAAAPLAVTSGEPAGVGPDLILSIWAARREHGVPPFFVTGSPSFLAGRARLMGLDAPVRVISDPAEAPALFKTALPVIDHGRDGFAEPGRPRPEAAAGTIESIRMAVALTRAGQASAVVTAPIAKSALYAAGFAHPGHTEFLAHLAADGGPEPRPVMMIWSDLLAVVPVTIHAPLARVPALLTRELIVETARITAADYSRRFGVPRPRLALAGLNPHAGEGGTMGREDEEIVRPAVEALRAEEIDASGPWPADTMFHARARAGYDVAVTMYHDQGLIPAKTLAFDEGVNVTLGLPFIRTSPDHGTAFDIAGKGLARPDSFLAALRLAARLAARERGE